MRAGRAARHGPGPSGRGGLVLIGLVVLGAGAAAVLWGRSSGDSPAPDEQRTFDPNTHPSTWPGTEITEEVAHGLEIGMAENPCVVYDPVAIVRNAPNVSLTFDWGEHHARRVTFVNDANGLRRLPGQDASGADATVLVLGDSHTYGLVDNEETFTALLERRLDAEAAGRRHAVLNAAVGGTGPHEYLGSLEIHAFRRPDLVVAVFFTGNDFINALRIDAFLNKVPPPPGDRAAQRRFSEARARWRLPLSQGFGQAQQFTLNPSQGEYAVGVCRDVFVRMDESCRRHGTRLLVVMLPAKVAVDGSDDEQTVGNLLRTLELEREDLDVNRRLGEDLVAALRAAGVDAIDLHPAMGGEHAPYYWRADHHLNVEGHARVAEALAPVVRDRLRGPP